MTVKKLGIVGMVLLLLLCGCEKNMDMEELQQQYQGIAKAQMSAEVVCHLSSENRSFTVECNYDREQGATTSITAPKEVKGISATVTGDKLTVAYDGTILPAGKLTDICPANCLPYLLHAISDGYIIEQGEETLEDSTCQRIAFDTTAGDGSKILCTVWFDGSNTPCYAEFAQNDKVILTARLLSFRVL